MATRDVDFHCNDYNSDNVFSSINVHHGASSSGGGAAPPRHLATQQGVDDAAFSANCNDGEEATDGWSSDTDGACEAFSSTADPFAADLPIEDRIEQLVRWYFASCVVA